ncbi:MAG: hypothetical protein KatS3mg054_0079 [Chloroflexus sp.]|nr:MAG: hypothetical protein KatS3mg054_0079 [Chloroflexus sp.]
MPDDRFWFGTQTIKLSVVVLVVGLAAMAKANVGKLFDIVKIAGFECKKMTKLRLACWSCRLAAT